MRQRHSPRGGIDMRQRAGRSAHVMLSTTGELLELLAQQRLVDLRAREPDG